MFVLSSVQRVYIILWEPTSISIEKKKVQDVFPLISICPVIGHNQTEFDASGYLTLIDYFAGIISLDNNTGIIKYTFILFKWKLDNGPPLIQISKIITATLKL